MRQRAEDEPRPPPGRRERRKRLGRALVKPARLLACAGALAAPSAARAEPPAAPPVEAPAEPSRIRRYLPQARNFVGVGPIFGLTGHVDSPVAGVLGVELSYVRYPVGAFGFGLGAFAQAQSVGLTHGRWAVGPQINFMMFGAELGAFIEEGHGGRATTIGLHASPFVSIGFFSAALRIGIPVGTLAEGTPYGLDLGLICAIKAPIPLDGQLFGLAFH